mgnify:CR=1 FL=1
MHIGHGQIEPMQDRINALAVAQGWIDDGLYRNHFGLTAEAIIALQECQHVIESLCRLPASRNALQSLVIDDLYSEEPLADERRRAIRQTWEGIFGVARDEAARTGVYGGDLAEEIIAATTPGTDGETALTRDYEPLSLAQALRCRAYNPLCGQPEDAADFHPPPVPAVPPGSLCEACLDAMAVVLAPAPWGGDMGVCVACQEGGRGDTGVPAWSVALDWEERG